MKLTFEFDIPEERDEFELALNGWKYKCIIDDMYSWLRYLSKHTETETLTIEQVREKLSELNKEYFE